VQGGVSLVQGKFDGVAVQWSGGRVEEKDHGTEGRIKMKKFMA
jgi:hypothetical protein